MASTVTATGISTGKSSSLPWIADCDDSATYGGESTVVVNKNNEHDTRPSVTVLLNDNKDKIDLVHQELSVDPLYDRTKHDDLWVLRFLLSHNKKIPATVAAAKHTLVFRNEHKLDEQDIRFVDPLDGFAKDAIQRYSKYYDDDALLFVLPDKERGVVAFINIGGCDQDGLVKNVSEEDWLPSFLFYTEWAHQWQDYTTRVTGRLTKSIRLIDASTLKITKGYHAEKSRRDGKVMGLMEDCYPQLLQTLYICDAPGWMQVPWRILRHVFPKRVTSKMDFISPKKNVTERQRLLQHISIENLPTRYGGLNTQWPPIFPITKEKKRKWMYSKL